MSENLKKWLPSLPAECGSIAVQYEYKSSLQTNQSQLLTRTKKKVFSIRRVGGDPCVPVWWHGGRPVESDLFLPSLMADCAGHRREWTVCLT